MMVCATLLSLLSVEARAQTEVYLGQLLPVAFNYCPRNSLPADGRLLPISQNVALFSLIGTYYGGDGKSNFALPDLRGRVPLGQGQAPGIATGGACRTGWDTTSAD
jgi:microcystin-dependent protein